ncbi:MAG: hypothetical protein WC712_10865 [Candidatus Brocadiia bacterium]
MRLSAFFLVLLQLAALSLFLAGRLPAEDEAQDFFAHKYTCSVRPCGQVGNTICLASRSWRFRFLFNFVTGAVTRVTSAMEVNISRTENHFIRWTDFPGKHSMLIEVLNQDGAIVGSSGEFVPIEVKNEERDYPYQPHAVELKNTVVAICHDEAVVIPLDGKRKVEHLASRHWETAICDNKVLHVGTGVLRTLYDESGAALSETPCDFTGKIVKTDSLNAGFFIVMGGDGNNAGFTAISADGRSLATYPSADLVPLDGFLVGNTLWLMCSSPNAPGGGHLAPICFDSVEKKWSLAKGIPVGSGDIRKLGTSKVLYRIGNTFHSFDPASGKTETFLVCPGKLPYPWLILDKDLAPALVVTTDYRNDKEPLTTYYGRNPELLKKVEELAAAEESKEWARATGSPADCCLRASGCR